MNRRARQPLPAEIALEQAYALAEEARRELDSLLSRLDTDTGSLERKEERLFALRALARKYGVTPDELPAIRDDFVAKQEALILGGDQIKKAQSRSRRRARGLFGRGAQAVQGARRRRRASWKRRSRRTGTAEAGPCQVSRRAGDAGRRQGRG